MHFRPHLTWSMVAQWPINVVQCPANLSCTVKLGCRQCWRISKSVTGVGDTWLGAWRNRGQSGCLWTVAWWWSSLSAWCTPCLSSGCSSMSRMIDVIFCLKIWQWEKQNKICWEFKDRIFRKMFLVVHAAIIRLESWLGRKRPGIVGQGRTIWNLMT